METLEQIIQEVCALGMHNLNFDFVHYGQGKVKLDAQQCVKTSDGGMTYINHLVFKSSARECLEALKARAQHGKAYEKL